MKYSINYFEDDLRILNEEVDNLKAKLSTLPSLHKNIIPLVKKVGALLLALLILASFPFFGQEAEGKETEILLLHTNSVTGHLFPCPTWGDRLLGGLARRVAYEEKVRAEKQRVLIIDSGDLFFAPSSGASSEKDLAKARLISRAYKQMGAAAINVGDLDLLQGVDFLRSEYSQGLPLISANLLNPSTKAPIFSPYVIRQAAGVRVAFFGLLPSEFPPGAGIAIKNANEGKILIKDPVEAARETVQKLKGQADLIVLLSDLGLYKDQTVAQAVPGIHFILGGHEGRFMKKSQQAGTTHILQSSVKGMYVGQLRLVFENPTSPFKDEGEPQQIQERINALDFQLRSLQGAKEGPAGQSMDNIDRSIQGVTRQKNALQEELKQAQNSSSQKNRFLFTLEPMEGRLPEDEEVRKWVSEAGIDKD